MTEPIQLFYLNTDQNQYWWSVENYTHLDGKRVSEPLNLYLYQFERNPIQPPPHGRHGDIVKFQGTSTTSALRAHVITITQVCQLIKTMDGLVVCDTDNPGRSTWRLNPFIDITMLSSRKCFNYRRVGEGFPELPLRLIHVDLTTPVKVNQDTYHLRINSKCPNSFKVLSIDTDHLSVILSLSPD